MQPEPQRQLRILISGSTGLIGRHLVADRRRRGDEVVPLVRTAGTASAIQWDPESGSLDPSLVSGFDVVIHLAGEPLGNARWNEAKKRKIVESRVRGTATLCGALAKAERPPAVLLSASGINYYGDRQDTLLDETMPAGKGFLADACIGWEGETASLDALSRVLHLRIGAVLTADGGTLPQMLPIFRAGLGGPIAGGKAYLSWISLRDLVRVVDHVMRMGDLRGPLNVVSPEPVTGRAFASALGAAVHKPAIVPVPGWLARLIVGEMANEVVLASVRAIPERLLASGFEFQDATLEEALAGCGISKA